MSSFRFSAFIVFIFARTTSVLPAAATSRSTPVPAEPSIMPLFASTSAQHIAPSIVEQVRQRFIQRSHRYLSLVPYASFSTFSAIAGRPLAE